MANPVKDYYKILGVGRSANAEEIKRVFRQLAKENHPDYNSSSKSEERFKDLNEAYEVLGDPERRKDYDRILAGGNGAANGVFGKANPASGSRPAAGEASHGGGAAAGASHLESEMTISLEEAYRGADRKITLAIQQSRLFGGMKESRKTYDVRIPPGIRDGQKIRLKNASGGDEDVLIRIRIAPHPRFTLEGDNLACEMRVTPWEAALGETIQAPTLDGSVALRLPSGVKSGQKLRMKGQGFPAKSGGRGDLYFRVMIAVPNPMSADERALFERLKAVSRFNPRG